MIIIMRNRAPQEQVQSVIDRITQLGFRPHVSAGEETTIIGVIGDERRLDESVFDLMDGVDRVVRVLKPFKLSSRDFHPENTVITVNGTPIGGDAVVVIGGPCTVESREQVFEAAEIIKALELYHAKLVDLGNEYGPDVVRAAINMLEDLRE